MRSGKMITSFTFDWLGYFEDIFAGCGAPGLWDLLTLSANMAVFPIISMSDSWALPVI